LKLVQFYGGRSVGLIRLVDGQRSFIEKPQEWLTLQYGYSSELRTCNGAQWVNVDLGNEYSINEVRLYPRKAGTGFPVDQDAATGLYSFQLVVLEDFSDPDAC
jgi:hypothetical protein